jgi:L-lactate utilization protein LutC
MDDAQKRHGPKAKSAKHRKNQKSAANNMKDASQKLSDMKSSMEEEQAAEDMQAIRQLLENIVQLSFDEEKLMKECESHQHQQSSLC